MNDGKDYVTRAYIGDVQGVVHKLDATDADPGNWEFGVFFEVTDEADEDEAQGDYNQPITARIAILKLLGADDIYLFLGTGGDSRVTRIRETYSSSWASTTPTIAAPFPPTTPRSRET